MIRDCYSSNDEFRDAFYAVKKGVEYAGATTETIELTRPFAQVNVATSDLAEVLRQGERPVKSTLTVTRLADKFDLFTGTASASQDVTASFTAAYIPGINELNKATYTVANVDNLTTGGKDYNYLAMAYVLVPGGKDATSVSDLTTVVTYDSGITTTVSYEGATLQQNRRTNLIGQLLTTSADYEIIVDEEFVKPDYDYEYENVTTVEEANSVFASGTTTSVKIETPITEDATIKLPLSAGETTVILPEIENNSVITFTYPEGATEEERPEVLNISAPENANIVLDVENTTVYINGKLQDVTSKTADQTLYVTAGTVVENLTVVKGNVRIEKGGVVTKICLADDAGNITVNVYLGEGVEKPEVAEDDADQIILIPFATPEEGTDKTLAEQVAEINYGKITLTEDVVLTETLTITAGKEIILDLNGKTISGTATEASASNLITVKGGANLSIKNGTVTFAATTPDTEWGGEGQPEYPDYANNAIRNEGVLTIENATIENKTKRGGASYVIDNYAGSELTVNNGSVITQSGGDVAIRMFNSSETSIDVTINGGTVTGYRAIWIQLAGSNTAVSPAMNVTVNGGSLNSCDPKYNMAIYSYSYGNDMKDVNIEINGGTFNGDVALTGGSNKTNIETVAVYGGTFTGLYSYGDDAKASDSITINGGTFSTFDVLTYMSEGEKATFKLDDGRTIVIDDIDATTKYVTNLEEMKNVLTAAGAAGAGNTTIHLMTDIDMTGSDWSPIAVDGYHGADVVTIEGHGSTITGLKAGLFKGGFAGGSGIVIKDLTISDSEIVADNDQGYGAFVGCADSMDEITLENCHLVNSSIITPNDGAAESRIGGLIGWTAGYNNQNDGPVDSYITIKNSSVKGCTLKGYGSIGGLVGHSGANAATYTIIKDCVVSDNKLISTDNDDWRVGVVVGTANNGQTTISGITESNNTLEQTGKTAPTGEKRNYYGRFVPSGTGILTIDGTAISE